MVEHEQVYPVWFSEMISPRHWATATESVLKLSLPWRMLRPQLISRSQYGMVNYQQWIRELSITEPKLEVLLFFPSYSPANSKLKLICSNFWAGVRYEYLGDDVQKPLQPGNHFSHYRHRSFR